MFICFLVKPWFWCCSEEIVCLFTDVAVYYKYAFYFTREKYRYLTNKVFSFIYIFYHFATFNNKCSSAGMMLVMYSFSEAVIQSIAQESGEFKHEILICSQMLSLTSSTHPIEYTIILKSYFHYHIKVIFPG